MGFNSPFKGLIGLIETDCLALLHLIQKVQVLNLSFETKVLLEIFLLFISSSRRMTPEEVTSGWAAMLSVHILANPLVTTQPTIQ
jgi:hypothetical protein